MRLVLLIHGGDIWVTKIWMIEVSWLVLSHLVHWNLGIHLWSRAQWSTGLIHWGLGIWVGGSGR